MLCFSVILKERIIFVFAPCFSLTRFKETSTYAYNPEYSVAGTAL